MTAALQNFEIVKGNTKILRIPITENGWPRPLTGLVCHWDLTTAAGAASILSKTTAAGITIPAAEGGTAQGATASALTLAAGASAEDGFYQGRHVRITSGPGAGQWRLITDYDGITKEAQLAPAWKTGGRPDNTSIYEIVDSSIDITLDDSDTAGLAAAEYFHRARVLDGASEPATVTIGTATLIDGIP